MRIAINAAFLGGRAEGLATYARSVIEYLSRSRDEVFVYTSDDTAADSNGLLQCRRTPSALRATAGSLANIVRAMAWTQTVLPLRLLRDHVDVLLCTMPEGMLVPVCSQVVVVHDLFPLFFPELYPRWKYYFRHVLPLVLKASRRVIADSEHTKGDLVRELGVEVGRITVIHPWVDPVFFSGDCAAPPDGYEPEPYFLFVGRSSPHKNIETVIRAFAAICREVPQRLSCVLGFSGDGDRAHCSRMLALAAQLGVRDRLTIYADLSREEILFLYRNATALLLLSKYEGFGYPPLEAMAVGTPAIVSDSTSLAEVSGPGALCVPNGEFERAAEAMLRLASDVDYRARLAEAGIAHARRFTVDATGRQILSVLERCALSA